MKIAYLTAKFPFAPVEPFLEPEIRGLARIAEVVVIAARPERKGSCYPDFGATPVHLAFLDARVVRLAWRELFRDPRAVGRAFARVAFGPSSPRSRLVNLLLFPKALAIAQTIRELGIEHVHASWLTTPATLGYVASLLTGIPFSMSAHSHDIRAQNLLEPKAAHAAFVRVISERNRRYVAERLSPASARRCKVVHLGVDVPAAIVHPPARVARILCCARLAEVKGHRYLVDALEMLQQHKVAFECDFAGDGELRSRIAAQVARAGLEHRVHLVGAIDHERLTAALAAGAYDIVVLASTERPEEHEGIPVALMEAMAAGVPAVATQTGSIDELVGPSAGILVPQRNPASLAGALERLISDPLERRRLGEGARAAVLAGFDGARTIRQLAGLMGADASGRAAVPTQVA